MYMYTKHQPEMMGNNDVFWLNSFLYYNDKRGGIRYCVIG